MPCWCISRPRPNKLGYYYLAACWFQSCLGLSRLPFCHVLGFQKWILFVLLRSLFIALGIFTSFGEWLLLFLEGCFEIRRTRLYDLVDRFFLHQILLSDLVFLPKSWIIYPSHSLNHFFNYGTFEIHPEALTFLFKFVKYGFSNRLFIFKGLLYFLLNF